MLKLRSLPQCGVAIALLCSVAVAQSTAPAVRILTPIDANHLVTLRGNVFPLANAAHDLGLVSPGFAMPDLTLVLIRSAAQQAAFDAYVAGEYDSSSPNFHRWLEPNEVGERFGPSTTDIATISNWLASQGFTVTGVSPDRMTIRFSGTAGQVRNAFHTEIHRLGADGRDVLREHERSADSGGAGTGGAGREVAAQFSAASRAQARRDGASGIRRRGSGSAWGTRLCPAPRLFRPGWRRQPAREWVRAFARSWVITAARAAIHTWSRTFRRGTLPPCTTCCRCGRRARRSTEPARRLPLPEPA